MAIFPGGPDGIMVPKASNAAEVIEISHYLAALEVREGKAVGATKLIIIATVTPQAVLALGGYPPALELCSGILFTTLIQPENQRTREPENQSLS